LLGFLLSPFDKLILAGQSFPVRARRCYYHPVQLARKMERKAAQAENQLRQEELQYFRAFLHRMPPGHLRDLLRTDRAAEIHCSSILGHQGNDLVKALETFVSKQGPIVYPDYPDGMRTPPVARREAMLLDFKETLEETEVSRFKYKPMDRFIQFLFDKQDYVRDYILNPKAADDVRINLEVLGEPFFDGRDPVEMFFQRYFEMRSALMHVGFVADMDRVLIAFSERGYYKTAEAEAQAENSEIASSGSEDTAESRGEQNANQVIENA
jgi:hypothetical protein